MTGSKSALLIIAGLILFLYALNHLSSALKEVSGEKLKRFLDRCTSNLYTGILTGVVITILLDSSSAVIIMTIALVNAKAMTFRQAMGVVMGANIGTTMSSQIFALNVGEYAALPIAAGFVLMIVGKKEIVRQVGKIFFSFGLIFFGLFTMEEAVAPLKSSNYFVSWLQSLESPLKGAFAGAFVTLVIQSSSATVGMVIGLASKGLMTLGAGIAVMLGAELGTCSDTLLATIGRSRQAIKTGVFHLIFNLITIVLCLLLLGWFTQLVLWISGDVTLARKIANAHMLFNSLGVLLMIPFVGLMEELLNKLVPVKFSSKTNNLEEMKVA